MLSIPRRRTQFQTSCIAVIASPFVRLLYLPVQSLLSIQQLPPTSMKWRKRLHDHYSVALDYAAQTDAKYVMMLEDDSMASIDLFKKLLPTLKKLDEEDPNWGLFSPYFSSHYEGWEKKDIWWLVVSCLLIGLALTFITMKSLPQKWTSKAVAVLLFAYFSALIILTALAVGKQNILPQVPNEPGVYRRKLFGGATALVYPKRVIPALQEYMNEGTHNLAHDLLIYNFIRENGLHEYGIVPTLFQHIGRASSDESRERRRFGELHTSTHFVRPI